MKKKFRSLDIDGENWAWQFYAKGDYYDCQSLKIWKDKKEVLTRQELNLLSEYYKSIYNDELISQSQERKNNISILFNCFLEGLKFINFENFFKIRSFLCKKIFSSVLFPFGLI